MKGNSLLLVAAIVATTSLPLFADNHLSLEQRIQQLEQQNITRGRLQTDLTMQVIELQKEVKALRGQVEEHEYKLQQIQERQRDLYRDIETRLSGVSATPVSKGTTSSATQPKPVIGAGVANSVKQSVVGDQGRLEFETAFKLVRNKQYSQAIDSFKAFLKKYPNGNYSDNARFWIGQVYFAQSKFTEAEQQFELMKQEFPDSSKLAAALLKLAEIKVRQEKWQQARSIYSEIIQRYTGSPQQLARKGLDDIKASGN